MVPSGGAVRDDNACGKRPLRTARQQRTISPILSRHCPIVIGRPLSRRHPAMAAAALFDRLLPQISGNELERRHHRIHEAQTTSDGSARQQKRLFCRWKRAAAVSRQRPFAISLLSLNEFLEHQRNENARFRGVLAPDQPPSHLGRGNPIIQLWLEPMIGDGALHGGREAASPPPSQRCALFVPALLRPRPIERKCYARNTRAGPSRPRQMTRHPAASRNPAAQPRRSSGL